MTSRQRFAFALALVFSGCSGIVGEEQPLDDWNGEPPITGSGGAGGATTGTGGAGGGSGGSDTTGTGGDTTGTGGGTTGTGGSTTGTGGATTGTGGSTTGTGGATTGTGGSTTGTGGATGGTGGSTGGSGGAPPDGGSTGGTSGTGGATGGTGGTGTGGATGGTGGATGGTGGATGGTGGATGGTGGTGGTGTGGTGGTGTGGAGGTGGTANCSLAVTVTTSQAGGRFQPRNIGSIWIANSSGAFVKSLKVWAATRIQYLTKWNSATQTAGSKGNVVDAVTGATLQSHQTHNVTWNCTDFKKAAVPDGMYSVFFEMTDADATGPSTSVSFTKGATGATVTPADATNFKGIKLVFTP